MMVFDCIVNHVPIKNIPKIIIQFSKRFGITLSDVPHRTVETMACELGFDATTQEGTHVNSIDVTMPTSCIDCAVDELPGGTYADYHKHITETVDNLS